MKIISHRQRVTVPHYEIFFQYADSKSLSGFGFTATADGKVDTAVLEKKPAALSNYRKCLSGEFAVKPGQFRFWEHDYIEAAIGKCICGCTVSLDSFTNTCECGRDYNMSGQELAARSQWGEETGETYADLQSL